MADTLEFVHKSTSAFKHQMKMKFVFHFSSSKLAVRSVHLPGRGCHQYPMESVYDDLDFLIGLVVDVTEFNRKQVFLFLFSISYCQEKYNTSKGFDVGNDKILLDEDAILIPKLIEVDDNGKVYKKYETIYNDTQCSVLDILRNAKCHYQLIHFIPTSKEKDIPTSLSIFLKDEYEEFKRDVLTADTLLLDPWWSIALNINKAGKMDCIIFHSAVMVFKLFDMFKELFKLDTFDYFKLQQTYVVI